MYREAADADEQAANPGEDELAASAGLYPGEGYVGGHYVGMSDSYPPDPAEQGWYDPALTTAQPPPKPPPPPPPPLDPPPQPSPSRSRSGGVFVKI